MSISQEPEPHATITRILLIEDDATISDLLAYNLKRAGYEVTQEYNGRTGLETALSRPVDLVLMDLMLPGLDGISATRELRRHKPLLPLIMVTALSEKERLLEGYALGVDDYVTKPFDLDVLLARISVILRRTAQPGAPTNDRREEAPARDVELLLDADTHSLRTETWAVPLTLKEYGLMQLLLSSPGHLFPKEEITERVWHHRYVASSRTLDVHARRLRDKLRHVNAPAAIHTVRGVGYRLVPLLPPVKEGE